MTAQSIITKVNISLYVTISTSLLSQKCPAADITPPTVPWVNILYCQCTFWQICRLFPFVFHKFSKLANFIQFVFGVFFAIKMSGKSGKFVIKSEESISRNI